MAGKKYLLLTSFTTPDEAGSGINAHNLCKALNAGGHQAKVLSFQRQRKSPKDILVTRIPYISNNFIGKVICLPIIFGYYIKHIIKHDVLFIFGNRIVAWEIALSLAKIFRKRIIFQSLLQGVDDPQTIIGNNRIKGFIYRYLLKSVNCYFSINPLFRNNWDRITGKNKLVFQSPQGVDNETFKPYTLQEKSTLKYRTGIDTSTYVLMSIGTLLHRKGLNIVFSSISKLPFEYNFYFIGGYQFGNKHFLKNYGSEAESLYHKAIQLLGSKINFTGFKQNIAEYLNCADVYIHGTAIEGFPNTILEAWACGVPVITSPIQGLVDTLFFNRKNCMIYTSEQELIKAVQEIKSNGELRSTLVKNALEFVQKQAAFKIIVQKLNSFIFN